MNAVMLTGRLTRDPEIKTTPKGEMATFAIAIQRGKGGNGASNCDFPHIVCFSNTVEFVKKWLKKGMKVEVQGTLHTGSYVSKTGQKVFTTDVWANFITFAESRNAVQDAYMGEDGELSRSDFVPVLEDEEWENSPFA